MSSVLIIADIEGSTGCSRVEDSRLFNDGWVKACVEMSRDVSCISHSLKEAGAERIRVKDFHRTGFNLFKELLPDFVELDQGYCAGPVPGIGDVNGFDLLIMTGMHAASGTNGFIPHTLTSRFAGIMVNGNLLSECELFASSVADAGLRPVFFSGDQTACDQATAVIKGIHTFPVNKPLQKSAEQTRHELAKAASSAISNQQTTAFQPAGPFSVKIRIRDGAPAAARLRKRQSFSGTDDYLEFTSESMSDLYWQLIRLAYLSPATERFIAQSLWAANFWGWLTLLWARRRAKKLQLT